jgi:hypothetical protein
MVHGVRAPRSPDPESEQWDARGAADSACFEWNDHCGGPVIRGVLLLLTPAKPTNHWGS